MSVVAVYVATRMCESEEKEIYHAELDSVLDQCPCPDELIILGDFNYASPSV